MAAIQGGSARIGRVTGEGIAANIGRHYSRWLLRGIVLLLIVANVINLGADLGAMGAAVRLVIGGSGRGYVIALAALCAWLEIFVQYRRYAAILKWMTLSLFAYFATVLIVLALAAGRVSGIAARTRTTATSPTSARLT